LFRRPGDLRTTGMNELFFALGIESWKGIAKTLLLPPLPFLALVLAGAGVLGRRRRIAWLMLAGGCAGLWLTCTVATGRFLLDVLLDPPPALSAQAVAALRDSPRTAIVVLGAGRQRFSPEYGTAILKPRGTERLRYGLWLSRHTGLPVAFSGGLAPGAGPGPSEAAIAARDAEQEFGIQLRWTEDRSRDTRENALYTIALLHPEGIGRIVLVTHADHMSRSLRNFDRAASGLGIDLVAAPVGVPASKDIAASDWLPSPSGFEMTWAVLYEWVGLLAGA
jgi:uncharacterized SAM-binding protein YcdF (DUF218 family)